MSSKVFSTEEVSQFDEKGYITFDLQVDYQLLDDIVRQMDSRYDQSHRRDGRYMHGSRIQDAWRVDDNVLRLATMPRILLGLQQLFDRKSLPFQTLNFPVGTQQRVHSDTIHFNSIPSGFVAGVWVALEEVTKSNGPLIYYPGSHKLPEYTMQDCQLGIGGENYRLYEDFIAARIEEFELQPEYGLLPKGHALIWHGNLLHGGSCQQQRNLTRNSQVTHYFFENCRYYTPLLSTPEKKNYRHPDWIARPKFGDKVVTLVKTAIRRSLALSKGRSR